MSCRRTVLPLVCKRWARTLWQPCAAWQECTSVSLRMLNWSPGQPLMLLNEATVIAWFGRSASLPRLRTVRLTTSPYQGSSLHAL